MRLLTGLLLFLINSHILKSADIQIGLFYGSPIHSVVFTVIDGQYRILADGKEIALLQKGSIVHIERYGSALSLNDTSGLYGHFSGLVFQQTGHEGIFRIKPVFPPLPSKESEGNLNLSVVNESIRMINQMDLEKYIPGTVESEGGSNALPEYYKAQAVISRTYALRNYSRHAGEGFNLCDGVHCQAYNGKSRMNRMIYTAALETADDILADEAGNPVITAYHANCGGITSPASFVWSSDLSYLVPVHDPFCNRSSHRNWVRVIQVTSWETYLNSKGYSGNLSHLYISNGDIRRKYLDVENSLLMTDIRQHFNLKSSWFDVSLSGDQVSFKGHGYGHGLGLCQQGAMEMARVGYTYVDILMFYFKDLHLQKYAHP